MGKHKNRIKKQYKKHKQDGESMRDFLIRLSGNVRPEQQKHPIEKVDAQPELIEAAVRRGVAASAPESPQEAPEPADESQTEDEAPESLQGSLSGLRRDELNHMAKERGIKGFSKMKKAELIEVLSQ